MSDVRFREARQNHPREVAAGDHGIAGFATELVLSRIESGIANERWKFGHPYEDPAQTGTCFDDERDPGPTANELRVNGERANSVSGSHQCAGTDREEMETEIKKFARLLCHTK